MQKYDANEENEIIVNNMTIIYAYKACKRKENPIKDGRWKRQYIE